jgi:hypothetical protein
MELIDEQLCKATKRLQWEWPGYHRLGIASDADRRNLLEPKCKVFENLSIQSISQVKQICAVI